MSDGFDLGCSWMGRLGMILGDVRMISMPLQGDFRARIALYGIRREQGDQPHVLYVVLIPGCSRRD